MIVSYPMAWAWVGSAQATALLDKDTGNCTGIGFINYMSAEAAEKAWFEANIAQWLEHSCRLAVNG